MSVSNLAPRSRRAANAPGNPRECTIWEAKRCDIKFKVRTATCSAILFSFRSRGWPADTRARFGVLPRPSAGAAPMCACAGPTPA